MNRKKASFSNNILKTVRLIMAIAFVIIFLAGTGLLYIMEGDIRSFAIKTGIMFLSFLVLYIILMSSLSNNIKKQFAPLDKLAYGLKDNSIEIIGDNDDIKLFARQLKADMEKLDSLESELAETRDNLDDMYMLNEKTIADAENYLDDFKKNLVKITKRQKRIKEMSKEISSASDEISSYSSSIKMKQRDINEHSYDLLDSISQNIRQQNDIKQDFDKSEESFKMLYSMLNESVEMIDSLFSELSTMQNLASQINLYAMNTSLEAARTGIFNMNITNALDEMKEMSSKMQSKADDIAMLSIRSKNSLNLAMEQSEFCRDNNEDNIQCFDQSVERLSNLSDELNKAVNLIEELSDNTAKVLASMEHIDNSNVKIISDCDYVLDASKILGDNIHGIDKAIKSKEI